MRTVLIDRKVPPMQLSANAGYRKDHEDGLAGKFTINYYQRTLGPPDYMYMYNLFVYYLLAH
eukprot:SAG22_NODE_7951_length_695_cov_1.384228_1_plen_62_part_00